MFPGTASPRGSASIGVEPIASVEVSSEDCDYPTKKIAKEKPVNEEIQNKNAVQDLNLHRMYDSR